MYAKLHDHERRGKTFVKALPYTFIGYSPDQKALRLKDPNSSLIIVRSFQDIKFLSTFIAKSPHVTMTALDEYVYNQYNQIEDATYDPDSDTNSNDTSPLNILNADNESEYFEPDVLLDDLNAPKSDPCILTSGNINSPDFVAVILFVDDLKIFGQTISITKVKAALSSEYDMKTLNTNDSYVGFEILRNRTQKTLKLSQTKFTKQIIQDLIMYQPDEYMCTTPMDPKVKHLPFEGTATVEDIRRYQTAIGNLGYLVIGTRPDIAYSYSILNQFVSNPGKLHWDAVLKIYRYLATTPGKGIVFGTAEWQPSAYCDANHGGHVTDNVSIAPRSHSGYIFLASGGPFAWKSKRQSRTVPSSFDSEAIALRIATIQARYFKNFYHELGLTINPIQIREDNTSVIKCTTTPRHALTKASNSDFHIIRESIAANEITLEFVKSKDNIADCLTKPLFGPSIQRFNKLMGVV